MVYHYEVFMGIINYQWSCAAAWDIVTQSLYNDHV